MSSHRLASLVLSLVLIAALYVVSNAEADSSIAKHARKAFTGSEVPR